MVVRKHFIIKGSVQGVGFRWRAARLARHLGLAGYVRNLPDGDVEMEIEGEEAMIGQVILDLSESPFIRIEDLITKRLPPEGGDGFRVL